MSRLVPVLLVSSVAALCGDEPAFDPFSEPAGTPYELALPPGVPPPDLPADYPFTHERVVLGRALFYDGVLSRNRRVSCGSCHRRRFAHADNRQFSIGIDRQATTRNAMPLFNVAWKKQFFWDGRAPSLRAQVLMPVQDHREMDASLDDVLARLVRDPLYRRTFEEAFGTPEVTAERIAVALEQFLVARTSFDSKFDQSLRGEATLTNEEELGRKLFMNQFRPNSAATGAGCVRCHGGPFFSDHEFRNNGLKPTDDLGRQSVTGIPEDRHKFATPTLRNVALTAPYMHDGRFTSLAEVIEHYNSGLHRPSLDPGLAAQPPGGLRLDDHLKAALLAFLETLTDPKYVP